MLTVAYKCTMTSIGLTACSTSLSSQSPITLSKIGLKTATYELKIAVTSVDISNLATHPVYVLRGTIPRRYGAMDIIAFNIYTATDPTQVFGGTGSITVPVTGTEDVLVVLKIQIPSSSVVTTTDLSSSVGLVTEKDILNTLPKASITTFGVVSEGSNIDIENGVISVPVATKTTSGVVKIGDYFQGGNYGPLILAPNYTRTEVADVSVAQVYAIPNTLMDVFVYNFKETPPATGVKSTTNPSTITTIPTGIGVIRCNRNLFYINANFSGPGFISDFYFRIYAYQGELSAPYIHPCWLLQHFGFSRDDVISISFYVRPSVGLKITQVEVFGTVMKLPEPVDCIENAWTRVKVQGLAIVDKSVPTFYIYHDATVVVNETIAIGRIQVEPGARCTEYEELCYEYRTTYTIPNPIERIGKISVANSNYVEVWNEVSFNGTEEGWTTEAHSVGSHFVLSVPNVDDTVVATSGEMKAICTHFTLGSIGDSAGTFSVSADPINNATVFRFSTAFVEQTSFISYLQEQVTAGTPVRVLYKCTGAGTFDGGGAYNRITSLERPLGSDDNLPQMTSLYCTEPDVLVTVQYFASIAGSHKALTEHKKELDVKIPRMAATASMPDTKYIEISLPTNGTFTAPADGYVVMCQSASAITEVLILKNNTTLLETRTPAGATYDLACTAIMPCKKGEVISNTGSFSGALAYPTRFYFANGSL